MILVQIIKHHRSLNPDFKTIPLQLYFDISWLAIAAKGREIKKTCEGELAFKMVVSLLQ